MLVNLAFVTGWVEEGQQRPAFEYDTDLNHALYLLGLAHESQGNLTQAARYFLEAIKVWPEDAQSYVAYSNTEVDLERQIEVLEGGLCIFDDPSVRFNLAHAYMDLERFGKALVHLEAIDSEWDDFPKVLNDLALIKLVLRE